MVKSKSLWVSLLQDPVASTETLERSERVLVDLRASASFYRVFSYLFVFVATCRSVLVPGLLGLAGVRLVLPLV
jgi:hypothetical protein